MWLLTKQNFKALKITRSCIMMLENRQFKTACGYWYSKILWHWKQKEDLLWCKKVVFQRICLTCKTENLLHPTYLWIMFLEVLNFCNHTNFSWFHSFKFSLNNTHLDLFNSYTSCNKASCSSNSSTERKANKS